jgi:hypothetical protein
VFAYENFAERKFSKLSLPTDTIVL